MAVPPATKRQPNRQLSEKSELPQQPAEIIDVAVVNAKANSNAQAKPKAKRGNSGKAKRGGAQRNSNSVANSTAVDKVTRGMKDLAVNGNSDEHHEEILYSLTCPAEHSASQVTFDLFQNNSKELLFKITKSEADNSFHRVIAPFSLCETFIEKLNLGLNELNANKEAGILNQLTTEQNALFVNMLSSSSKQSKYYIDFKSNDEKTEIILQISEKKRTMRKNGPSIRNYILEFNVMDMHTLTEKITNFYQGAMEAITSKPNLEFHKVYGGNDFTVEWIKPKNEINLLLKLCSVNGSRIIFPVNTVQQLIRTLQDVYETCEKCCTDPDAYMKVMEEKREEQNKRREKNGIPLLPSHPEPLDEKIKKNRGKADTEEGAHQSPYKLLYTQKMVSYSNKRTYHFDVLLHNEGGEVRLRIVEQQHTHGAAQQNNEFKKGRQLRHSIYVQVNKISDLIEILTKANEEVPLPKEKAHYYPGGRCFFKMNVRPRGLVLKIKTQTAIHADEDAANSELPDENGSHQANNVTKYGPATTVELSKGCIRTLMNYTNWLIETPHSMTD